MRPLSPNQTHAMRPYHARSVETPDDFVPATSGLDVAAGFADRSPGYAHRDPFFAEAREALFGRSVDLLTEDMIRNPIVRREVEAHRTLVHEANNREAAA